MKIDNEVLYQKALDDMAYLHDQLKKLRQSIVNQENYIFDYQSSYKYREDRHITKFSKRVEVAGIEMNCGKSILDKEK